MKDRFGFDWSNIRGKRFWSAPQIERRVFFRHMASAVGGYFLLPTRPMETIARAAATPISKAKNCIYILMQGGPSHSDTFDLKEGSWTPSYFAPTSYGDIRFPQGLMPKIADQMSNVAFVRSMNTWALVHSLSQTWIQIGRNPLNGTSKIAPHIGSVVSMELGPKSADRTLPPFLSLNANGGPDNGYFPAEMAPFYVSPGGGGLADTTHSAGTTIFDRRYGLLLQMDSAVRSTDVLGTPPLEMAAFNASARKLMYNTAVNNVFVFDQTTKNSYGNTTFGNACITARNLIRANMGTRFIQITFGSWDHHSSIYNVNGPLQTIAKQFDLGVGQLMNDLRSDGTLNDTLIVAMGEFGRTVGAPNVQAGRDHFLQQSVMFAGAGVSGGRAVGVTDATASKTTDPGWWRQRDVKPEDIEATIYSALGIDWTTVRHDDPLGRGFEYVPFASSQDLYGPIHELWA